MLQIRIADIMDYEKIIDFYYSLTDAMKDAQYKPGWEKDIYPTQGFLMKSIENDELYIGELDRKAVSCMVVNHEYNDGYKGIRWSVEADDDELLVIHALGVDPAFSGKGFAKQMVQQVIHIAREKHMKVIRLDVLEGNIPAEKAYTQLGFTYIETVQMFYEDTGWTNYKLFEYTVE